jgi:hypothetical protein
VRVAHAERPAAADFYGIGGRVTLALSLDATGNVTGIRPLAWSSPMFVAAAEAAARASTFAPAVRQCVPAASTYVFAVNFPAPQSPPQLHADPVAFLTGLWRCTSADGTTRMQIFMHDGNGFNASDGASVKSAAPDKTRTWAIRRDNAVIAWAYPWVGETWDWSTIMTEDRAIRFKRVDDATLSLITITGAPPAQTERTERCTRVPASVVP